VGLGEEEEKEKKLVQLQKSKLRSFRDPKLTIILQKEDKITKNIVQQQALKHLFLIAHININKTAVFKTSKIFMAQVIFHKIEQKYFKFNILSLVFE
jgi:hypothetical protein